MIFKQAIRKLKRYYRGFNAAYIFLSIRFFFAPYREIEKKLPDSGCILDLGCGYGIFSNFIALMSKNRQIIGLDIDESKLKQAKKGLENTQFKKMDIMKYDLPESSGIVFIHVLHHLSSKEDQRNLIKKSFASLKKGGVLVIGEIALKAPFWQILLTRCVDFILYPRDKIFYLKEDSLKKLLEEYFSEVEVNWYSKYFPFPQVVYRAVK